MQRYDAFSAHQEADRTPSSRVPSACRRCRQQKLKCDVQRPCTLCSRAGVTCETAIKPVAWKVHYPIEAPKRAHGQTTHNIRAKRIRQDINGDEHTTVASSAKANDFANANLDGAECDCSTLDDEGPQWIPSSAAVQLMEEAFHQHNTATPEGTETSAFSASQWNQPDVESDPRGGVTSSISKTNNANFFDQESPRDRAIAFAGLGPAEAELLSLLPQVEPATLLVENYFSRIHWFMLVFHQCEFRDRFRKLYGNLNNPHTARNAPIGFLGIMSAVFILSLSYTTAQQKEKLAEYGIEADLLRKRLLSSLKLRLLDIVCQGSIEAVQVCVLLGSFYLYHGEPALAWPICGCGLRIAQALNLHRRRPSHAQPSELDPQVRHAEETRKRCWWAVYDIETFCSMLYGFPLSINDDDCDIEILDPYPYRPNDPDWESDLWRRTGRATPLSYRNAMIRLSIIVKSALVDLYRLRRNPPGEKTSRLSDQSRVHSVSATVANLERRLQALYKSLPEPLKIDPSAGPPRDLPPNDLFPYQALAFRLAFENARILIHRPLLSYKMVSSISAQSAQGRSVSPLADSFRSSIQTCREAALQISSISSLPVIKDAADTYAVSLISLHSLTAAVTLSIITSLDPLSREAHDCKMGIRQLMEMQARLKARSIVAEQGLSILKKLMSLVLTKERERMLEFPDKPDDFGGIEVDTTRVPPLSSSNPPKQKQYTFQEETPYRSQPPAQIAAEPLPTPSTSMEPIDGLGVDFYEDPMITQVLHDFEQAINSPNSFPGDQEFSTFGSDQWMGTCFNSPDQSWIWGSNYQL